MASVVEALSVLLMIVVIVWCRLLYFRGVAFYAQKKYKRALEDLKAAASQFSGTGPSFAADWCFFV